MVQAISIQGRTIINSQTLICRDYAAVIPPFFNCSLGGVITDTVGSGTGFATTFDTINDRINYRASFNSTAKTAPFSSSIAYRIFPDRFNAETPVTSVYVSASVSGSPASTTSVRIWFSYSDYLVSNSPNYTQIINSNPMHDYCFVPASDGSVVAIDLQSVAAPGTSYPYAYFIGSVDCGAYDVYPAGFALVNGTEKVYASSGIEPSAICAGEGVVGFGAWRSSCLTSSKNWMIGNDGQQLIVVDKNGTESLAATPSGNFYANLYYWDFLGYLPSGITWGSITGGTKETDGGYTSLVIADLVSNTNTYAYATNGGHYWATGTLPIIGITATYVHNTFVITPYGSVLAYSYDGINWSTTSLPYGENWISCFFCSDSYFYLISSSGKVIKSQSIDIMNSPPFWTTVATTGKSFFKVVYGKCNISSIFVGTDTFVGKINSTSISYSTDRGLTWTDVDLSSSFPDVSILDIASGNNGLSLSNYFVITNASPSANQIFYSIDGINWNNSYSAVSSLNSAFSIAAMPGLVL